MTTAMIVKTIESPMSAMRGRFQYRRKADEFNVSPAALRPSTSRNCNSADHPNNGGTTGGHNTGHGD